MSHLNHFFAASDAGTNLKKAAYHECNSVIVEKGAYTCFFYFSGYL